MTPRSRHRPNVLFIVIDDLNDWVGACAGHPQTLTPNIDRLARRGVLFRHAYCQAPMCNPSRTSALTGLRPTTSGVYTNGDVWRDALPDAVTLPQYFQQAGYVVAGGGKVFHGPQNDRRSWQAYYNFEGFIHPPDAPVNPIPNARQFDWSPIDADDQETADTRLARWVGRFLSKRRNQPFFLACGLYRPHLPWYAPQKYFRKFPPERIKLPDVVQDDLGDVPKSAINGLRDHRNITAYDQWKNAVAGYLACINYTDANVGRVLDSLDQSPHSDNTIVVLWGDNGFHLGEKQHWRKFTLWEPSCHVPLIIAFPGRVRGSRECTKPVELLDLYPTLIELANLPQKDNLDGRSLVTLLEDPNGQWDGAAMASNGPDRITVRTERWRYSRYPDGEELYDHRQDPHEWHNLSHRREHAETKNRLSAWFPKSVSRRRVRQFRELSPEERNPVPIPRGRFSMSGELQNDVGVGTEI